jgi:hypothetical protein
MNLIYMQGHALEGTSLLRMGASEKEISQASKTLQRSPAEPFAWCGQLQQNLISMRVTRNSVQRMKKE